MLFHLVLVVQFSLDSRYVKRATGTLGLQSFAGTASRPAPGGPARLAKPAAAQIRKLSPSLLPPSPNSGQQGRASRRSKRAASPYLPDSQEGAEEELQEEEVEGEGEGGSSDEGEGEDEDEKEKKMQGKKGGGGEQKGKGKQQQRPQKRRKRLIPRELSAPSTSNKINVEKKATSSIGGGGSKKGGQQEEQQQQQQQQRQVQVCSLCIAEELPASLADTFIVICQNVVI